MNIRNIPQSILWGFVPGIITSSIGAYKATLYEEFEILKYFRSAVITFLWYILIDFYFPIDPVLLKIGLCSMMERVSVETYKAIYKPNPGKFKNCSCENNQCIVHKDRGWVLDRLSGSKGNYNGKMEI